MRRLLLASIVLTLLASAGTLAAKQGSYGWLDGTTEGVCRYNKTAEPPCGPGMKLGKTYRYRIYSHCGAIETWLDGERWRASPRIQRDNRMGFNSTGGKIRLVERNTARFLGPNGLKIVFLRGAAAAWGCK